METTTTPKGPTRDAAIAYRERELARIAGMTFRSDPGDDGMSASEKRDMWHGEIAPMLRGQIRALAKLAPDASGVDVLRACGFTEQQIEAVYRIGGAS